MLSSQDFRMFSIGDTIDNEYTVDGVCSTTGGMGAILFVTSRTKNFVISKVVLKYCRETDDEYLRRFRRETRLLLAFAGNSKVTQILDHNLEHDPPYYVMPFYTDGDLTTLHATIKDDLTAQETLFIQMIDCVAELHAKDTFHRDIKPQNFLRDNAAIRVSDLGLSTEIDSLTAFTQTSQFWGTHGYLPPEFHAGGFKHADAAGDIFMLGKSFYVILTQRNPMYVIGNNIPDPLFHLIQKCCNIEKARRYQSLAELKQAVVAVYDILLKRVDGEIRAKQLLSTISTRLSEQHNFEPKEVTEFLDCLTRLDPEEKKVVVSELPFLFYQILTFSEFSPRVTEFLEQYGPMVEAYDYGWGYAEIIADNMKMLFDSPNVADSDKATALDLAMGAAYAMNRFAAMDTCQIMIKSVSTDGLAILTRDVIRNYKKPFVYDIEPVNCQHDTIASTVHEMKREADAE
jgi:eukaryotic-like serine/threonine-protein kinase